MPRPRGPKSEVGPEIHDLCFELYAKRGMSYQSIAEYLKKHEGIVHWDDPTRPVVRTTVMRWVHKSHKRLQKENVHRQALEETIVGCELDQLKEVLFEMLQNKAQMSFEDRCRFVEVWLKYRKERSSTYGVYPPRRKEVALTHTGGVDPEGLDPKAEANLIAFESWLADDKRARTR